MNPHPHTDDLTGPRTSTTSVCCAVAATIRSTTTDGESSKPLTGTTYCDHRTPNTAHPSPARPPTGADLANPRPSCCCETRSRPRNNPHHMGWLPACYRPTLTNSYSTPTVRDQSSTRTGTTQTAKHRPYPGLGKSRKPTERWWRGEGPRDKTDFPDFRDLVLLAGDSLPGVTQSSGRRRDRWSCRWPSANPPRLGTPPRPLCLRGHR